MAEQIAASLSQQIVSTVVFAVLVCSESLSGSPLVCVPQIDTQSKVDRGIDKLRADLYSLESRHERALQVRRCIIMQPLYLHPTFHRDGSLPCCSFS
jgi:hypothetical protein